MAAETTAPEVHAYTQAELASPATIESIKTKLDTVDQSNEAAIDAAILDLEQTGVLGRDESENAKPDKIFGGTELVSNTSNAEVNRRVAELRTNKINHVSTRFAAGVQTKYEGSEPENVGAALAGLFAEKYLAGEVELAQVSRRDGTGRNARTVRTIEPKLTNVDPLAKANDLVVANYLAVLDPEQKAKFQEAIGANFDQLVAQRTAQERRTSQIHQAERQAAAEQKAQDEAEKQFMQERDAWHAAAKEGRDIIKTSSPDIQKGFETRLKAAKTEAEKEQIDIEFDEIAVQALNASNQHKAEQAAIRQQALAEQAREAVITAHEDAVGRAAEAETREALPKTAKAREKKLDALQDAAIEMDADRSIDVGLVENQKRIDAANEHAKNMLDPEYKAKHDITEKLTTAYETRINAATNDRDKAELAALRDKEIADETRKIDAARPNQLTMAELAAKQVKDAEDKTAFDDQINRLGAAKADKEAAYDQAIKTDNEYFGSADALKVGAEYDARIAAETNPVLINELKTAREKAMADTREAALAKNKAEVALKMEALAVGTQMRDAIAKKEVAINALVMSDDNAEAKAKARHDELHMSAMPFLEKRTGGLFGRNRGPKVVERYYRDPTNDNLVMVERRRRKTGEFISQTLITTERPLRMRQTMADNITIAPREISKAMKDIRQADRSHMIGAGMGGLRDRISPTPGLGSAFTGDGTGRKPVGADQVYGADATKMKKRGAISKRGGFLFWLTGR
ncbi:hypothetical protein HJC99_06590 [Candidatus Saccharibacteria bacterium]|nr:hypothetical protein [Candidatus Saccharibacteria bacterium]